MRNGCRRSPRPISIKSVLFYTVLLVLLPGTLSPPDQNELYSVELAVGRAASHHISRHYRFGGSRFRPRSDHGDRSSKKKPAEPRCSLRHLSDHRHVFLMAPRIVPEQLMGCPESGRKDRINLNSFFERTQGHFLSPCSRHGSLCTKQPR
jgi:hypothetical protein